MCLNSQQKCVNFIKLSIKRVEISYEAPKEL
jgi:hypothetical protein